MFQTPGRSTVFAGEAMAATSHPLATQVALDAMARGGNAADAMAAAAFLLGLCEPAMTGLGGDAFAMIWAPGADRPLGINGSGRAPAGIDVEAVRGAGAAIDPDTAHAATIPGAVDALLHLVEAYGTMGREAALAPSVHYAEAGIPTAPRVAFDWAQGAPRFNPAMKRHFLRGGAVPRIGDVMRYPGQAEVLRRIAREGREGFYAGPVAEDMVSSLRALGGAHTLDDFAAHRWSPADPVSTDYRGTTIWELPPNGQGATALLMAHMLSGIDIRALDPFGAERAHWEAETTRLAYAMRDALIADPDVAGTDARLSRMLDPGIANDLRGRIDPDRAGPRAPAVPEAQQKDTVYLCAIDRDGMAVSLIYSIFHGFGSALASERHGINFQNRGAGFSLDAGSPNVLAPGKRPLHTIIPAMLSRGGALLGPFGVMGGAYQPTGHIRLVSNLVDYGMDLQEAVDAPRCFADADGLQVEAGYDRAVIERLAAMGHEPRRPDVGIGGAQIVLRDLERGILAGASDPRKDGCALGF